MTQKYKIMRYYKADRRPRVMKRNLTLAQAQKHCRNPKTSGKGFFDGYTKQ